MMEKGDTPAIKREPPAEVKQILREEVGFGCPVPDCREPFLTWHHFAPQWHVRHHHEPQGMIALCAKHHAMADRGVFDKAQLSAFKNAPHSVEEVKAKFEWARPKQLIRLGGFYFGGKNIGMSVATGVVKDEFVGLQENSAGLLELSFVLRDKGMNRVAVMKNNMFVARPDGVFDLEVNAGATRIKIRRQKGKVLLDLHSGRKSPEELVQLLESDADRGYKTMQKKASASSLSVPVFRDYLLGPMTPIETGDDSPQASHWRDESSGEVVDSRQHVISFIYDWAMEYCVDAEGLIPVLDFRYVLSYILGKKFEIRNGIDVSPLKAYAFGAHLTPVPTRPSDKPDDPRPRKPWQP
jgi:hypothetical protein